MGGCLNITLKKELIALDKRFLRGCALKTEPHPRHAKHSTAKQRCCHGEHLHAICCSYWQVLTCLLLRQFTTRLPQKGTKKHRLKQRATPITGGRIYTSVEPHFCQHSTARHCRRADRTPPSANIGPFPRPFNVLSPVRMIYITTASSTRDFPWNTPCDVPWDVPQESK